MSMTHRSSLSLHCGHVLLASLALVLTACQGVNMGRANTAVAQLTPASGSAVTGQVTFEPSERGMTLHVQARNLAPNSVHGIHVHANGDCSAADATSAGGHFNPDRQDHAGPYQQHRHAGDLPNVVADAKGDINQRIVVENLTLARGDMTDIQGRSIVLHADADDYKSQPAGQSGQRIACGVIRIKTR